VSLREVKSGFPIRPMAGSKRSIEKRVIAQGFFEESVVNEMTTTGNVILPARSKVNGFLR
jgi:hypothetical protein